MAESISVNNRPRGFPHGFSPRAYFPVGAPKSSSATKNLWSLGNSRRDQERVQRQPETPDLAAPGNSSRTLNRAQPRENPNLLGLENNRRSQNRVQPRENQNRVRQSSESATLHVIRYWSKERNRDRVLEILKRFRERCDEIRRSNRQVRPESKALPEFRALITGHAKSIGPIPGVEIGQVFRNRVELIIAGVHGHTVNGIEFTKPLHGRSVATCVVAQDGYYDNMSKPEFLQYGGEGGEISRNSSKSRNKLKIRKSDQVMERGNLALKNSIEVKNEVRVVRDVKYAGSRNGKVVYVYDGVYQVMAFRSIRGLEGNMLFQFDLRRFPGQKPVDWKNVDLVGV